MVVEECHFRHLLCILDDIYIPDEAIDGRIWERTTEEEFSVASFFQAVSVDDLLPLWLTYGSLGLLFEGWHVWLVGLPWRHLTMDNYVIVVNAWPMEKFVDRLLQNFTMA